MTITLAVLVARLTIDVPQQSGVPTVAQYTQAVKDAIDDLSRRVSVVRIATLAVVAGQAVYDLPADFVTLVRLSPIGVPFGAGGDGGYGRSGYVPNWGTLVSPAGLVPLSGGLNERITVVGDRLHIYPTPIATADRELVYAAGDALDDGTDSIYAVPTYPTLTSDRARVALLLARAACLERIASSPRADAIRIAGGDADIDTRQRAAELRSTAAALRQQYLDAVANLTTGVGGLW